MNAILAGLGGFFFLAQSIVVDRPYRDFDVVIQELEDYGTWQAAAESRYTFKPKNPPPAWSPYRDGQWIYTDYGWTWQGRDRAAWATHHYGHWKRDEAGGWIWTPGVHWLSASVEWLRSGSYIGWRPANLDRFYNFVEDPQAKKPGPEDWNFVLLEKIRGPLQPGDFASVEEAAALLEKAEPADHIFVAHWEIPRPGPSPEVLKNKDDKPDQIPVFPILRDRNTPGPDELTPEGYVAFRPRFHQDGDGIFRRVDVFLNPRKENPEYQSVKETLAPERKLTPAEQKKLDKLIERERLDKQHMENLYR